MRQELRVLMLGKAHQDILLNIALTAHKERIERILGGFLFGYVFIHE